jgi:DNA-binding transcriptional regulator GbsR (MarR family)
MKNTENAKAYASIKDIGRHIIDACTQWARIKGYSGSVGLLRGLTVLAKEPMSLDELVQETGYSKSTVSTSMNLLENLGLVERLVIPGDKRHLYTPIADSEIIRINILNSIDREMQLFIMALDKSENDILADGAEARYLLERFASLKQSYEQCKKAMDFLRKQSASEI